MHRCHRDRTVLRRGGAVRRRTPRHLALARRHRRRTDVPYLDQAARPHALGRPGAGLGGGLGGPAVLPPGGGSGRIPNTRIIGPSCLKICFTLWSPAGSASVSVNRRPPSAPGGGGSPPAGTHRSPPRLGRAS